MGGPTMVVSTVDRRTWVDVRISDRMCRVVSVTVVVPRDERWVSNRVVIVTLVGTV